MGFAKMNHMRRSTYWFKPFHIAVLVTLFFFAKTAGLLHSEIHPFHHHTVECDLYQGMAHPVSDQVETLDLALPTPTYSHFDERVFPVYPALAYPPFWGRAPPVFS